MMHEESRSQGCTITLTLEYNINSECLIHEYMHNCSKLITYRIPYSAIKLNYNNKIYVNIFDIEKLFPFEAVAFKFHFKFVPYHMHMSAVSRTLNARTPDIISKARKCKHLTACNKKTRRFLASTVRA